MDFFMTYFVFPLGTFGSAYLFTRERWIGSPVLLLGNFLIATSMAHTGISDQSFGIFVSAMVAGFYFGEKY